MPDVGGSLSSFATGNTPAVVDITSIPVGAWMIATLFQAGSYQTALPPVGWTNLLSTNSQQSGTRAQAYAGRIKQAEDTSISWGPEFTAQTGGRRLAVLWGEGAGPVSAWVHGLVGVRSATNVVSGQSVQAGTSTTSVAPPVTVEVDASLVIAILSEATTNTGTFTITSGATGFFSSGDAGTIEFIVAGSLTADAGTTAAVVATGSQTQAANGQALQIALPPGTPEPEPEPYRGFNSIAEMLATPGFTWAHRGLTTFAEESLYAYRQAVKIGHGALEVSLFRTSDGHWGAAHDNTPTRITGGAFTAAWSSYTRAQVEAMTITIGQGAPQPIAWWEQIRDEFGPTHVLVLDPKNYNWGTYQTEFLNMCDQLGPGRVIVKQYASDVSLASAAAARGYTTWGHTFDDFMADPNLNTYLSAWSLLGIDYAASQASWDVLLATGKPVVGHIADTQSAYNTAMAKGASGVQSTSAAIAPVSWWNTTPGPVTISGTIVQTVPAVTAGGSATITPPAWSGAIAAGVPAVTSSVAGAMVPPSVDGVVSMTTPAVVSEVAAAVAPPDGVACVVTAVTPAVQSAASGGVALPTVVGEVAATVAAVVQAAVATITGEGVIDAPPVDWPARLTLEASIDALNLTATVPELTLEATW